MNGKLLCASLTWVLTIAPGAVAAQGAIPSPDGIFTGCYSRAMGSLRVIDGIAGQCLHSEVRITWSQIGPAGPRGDTGQQGPAGPASLAALQGTPCVLPSGTASTVNVNVGADGAVTLRCALPVAPLGCPTATACSTNTDAACVWGGEQAYCSYEAYLGGKIIQALGWVAASPNDATTWAQATADLSSILADEWRNGAIVGNTPSEAFFARCDATTMTQGQREGAVLACVVGFAPLRPAEFVVLGVRERTAH